MLTLQEMTDVVRAWRENLQEDGKRPKEQYPDTGAIPLAYFDKICDTLNAEWNNAGSGLRIYYSMGDFRPSFKSQLEMF